MIKKKKNNKVILLFILLFTDYTNLFIFLKNYKNIGPNAVVLLDEVEKVIFYFKKKKKEKMIKKMFNGIYFILSIYKN